MIELEPQFEQIRQEFKASLPDLDPAPYARPDPNPLPFVTVARIMSIAAEWYGLTWADVTCSRRDQERCNCRQIIAYLARELTTVSFPRIGEIMDRDHSTVMKNADRASRRLANEKKFASDLKFIRSQVVQDG